MQRKIYSRTKSQDSNFLERVANESLGNLKRHSSWRVPLIVYLKQLHLKNLCDPSTVGFNSPFAHRNLFSRLHIRVKFNYDPKLKQSFTISFRASEKKLKTQYVTVKSTQ